MPTVTTQRSFAHPTCYHRRHRYYNLMRQSTPPNAVDVGVSHSVEGTDRACAFPALHTNPYDCAVALTPSVLQDASVQTCLGILPSPSLHWLGTLLLRLNCVRAVAITVLLIRRDIEIEDHSDPNNNKYGIKATTRYGLGVLRSNAIAKMTNIKTTL